MLVASLHPRTQSVWLYQLKYSGLYLWFYQWEFILIAYECLLSFLLGWKERRAKVIVIGLQLQKVVRLFW